jgi:hypothetical protein
MTESIEYAVGFVSSSRRVVKTIMELMHPKIVARNRDFDYLVRLKIMPSNRPSFKTTSGISSGESGIPA